MPQLPPPESLRALIAAAYQKREPIRRSNTDSYRVVHSHADGLPDVTIDVFGGECFVLSTYAAFTKEQEEQLAHALDVVGKVSAVYVKRRPKEARVVANTKPKDVSPGEPIRGTPWEGIATENGLKFHIRPSAGLSVGLFLDMRDTRAWVRDELRGRTVVNCFAYTCGFGVAAKRGAAARVVNIDVSRRVLDWGMENYELNQETAERRDFIAGDVFEWLERFKKKHESFDAVILDPPSFSTTDKTRFSAARDYPVLVKAAAALISEEAGGHVLACCNLSQLDRAAFRKLVSAGLPSRGRSSHQWLSASPLDFPEHANTPHRLHVLAVRLFGEDGAA